MKSGGSNPIDNNTTADRSILNQLPLPQGIKDAFARVRPVSEDETSFWAEINNEIIASGSFQDAGRLARLNDLAGPLSSGPASMLIWQKLNHRHTSQTLIAADINQNPVSAVRKIPVSIFNNVINLTHDGNYMLSGDNSFTTVHRGDFTWTIMQESPDLQNPISDGDEINDDLFFVSPNFFKENSELLGAAVVDTAILLRSVLEDLGFYKNRALFVPKIRVLANAGSSPSDGTFSGFRVETLSPEEWINVSDPSFAVLRVIRKLSPQIAARALKNLTSMAETLKRLGITMNSWTGLMVNFKTGEVSLGEGDRPVLLNSSLFSKALAISLEQPELYADNGGLPYFPNLASISIGSRKLSAAERQLIDIIILLRRISGRTKIQPTSENLLAQIIRDFGLFLNLAKNEYLTKAAADNKGTVEAIVEHYLSQFRIEIDTPDFKGTLNFMTHILPAMMIVLKPEEWFIVASRYIETAKKAHLSGQKNMDLYWEKISESLWGEIRMLREKQTGGGGRGGSPSETPGSDINSGGSGGGHIAQAKGADVMHPPIGWAASSAQQIPFQAYAPALLPVASSAPALQSGLMFFNIPPTTLLH